MGATFDYTCQQPLTPDAAQAIQDRAAELTRGYTWWAEGLWMQYDEERRLLEGFNKFNCNLPDELGFAADQYMGAKDVEFIVATLARLGAEFNVTWELGVVGEPLDQLQPGIPCPAADEFIQSMLEEAQQVFQDISYPPPGISREAFLQHYPDR